jgi:hypothetical protein
MQLLQFVVIMIVIGALLWLANNYLPMNRAILGVLNVVVVIAVIVFALDFFGILPMDRSFRIRN